MAVITFDAENNSISILVEKTDMIHTKEDNTTYISSGKKYSAGTVLANGPATVCIVRGERE